jgi:hypothetical protein
MSIIRHPRQRRSTQLQKLFYRRVAEHFASSQMLNPHRELRLAHFTPVSSREDQNEAQDVRAMNAVPA